jgi:hypothetical protein
MLKYWEQEAEQTDPSFAEVKRMIISEVRVGRQLRESAASVLRGSS